MTSNAALNAGPDSSIYTTSNGAPYPEPYEAQRVSYNKDPIAGPLLLQDFHHIDLLAHFDRERIPERVVHANGGGAHGFFQTTHDVSDLTCANLFNEIGKRTSATVRFSTVAGETGFPDTYRDPRGMSIKLRTEEGNWDMVNNNTPVFFLRDPAKFPHFIHSQKRDPQTFLRSADVFWDYLSQNEESVHQVIWLFGDRGIPDSWARIQSYSGNTFIWVNADGVRTYVQIHFKSDQGVGYLSQEKACEIAGKENDFHKADLFSRIEKGDYPSWTMSVQTMTQEQADAFPYSVFDLTKVWSQKDYPLRPVGKLTLDRAVENHFAEIEQIAFSPSHLVPGMEPSADPVLQSRLFSYPDTHRHRLGVNYQMIPVNAPLAPVANFQRDGFMNVSKNGGAKPNYASSFAPLSYTSQRVPNTVQGSVASGGKPAKQGAATGDHFTNDNSGSQQTPSSAPKQNGHIGKTTKSRTYPTSRLAGPEIEAFLSDVADADFEQPRVLWQKVFDDAQRERFFTNVAGHISACKRDDIRERQLAVFDKVDPQISAGIRKVLKELAQQ